MKLCSRCKQLKPATTDYFVRDKNRKDGLKVSCKECDRQYYLANREKICRASSDYRNSHKEHVLQVEKKYRERNKSILSERQKKYREDHKDELRIRRENNREKHIEWCRTWHLQNKDHCKEYAKRYAEKNDEVIKQKRLERRKELNEKSRKYRQEYPERRRATLRQYHLKNKDEERARKHVRQAREKNLLRSLTIQEWRESLRFFNNQCAYCGRIEETLHQEHVVPVAKGGPYTRSNIIPACQFCNCSKQDRDLFVWYPKQVFFDIKRLKKIQQWTGYNILHQQQALF